MEESVEGDCERRMCAKDGLADVEDAKLVGFFFCLFLGAGRDCTELGMEIRGAVELHGVGGGGSRGREAEAAAKDGKLTAARLIF